MKWVMRAGTLVLGAFTLSGCIYEIHRERVTPVEVRTETSDGRTTVTRTEVVSREVRYYAPPVYVSPPPVYVSPWTAYPYCAPSYCAPYPSFSFHYFAGRGRHCW